MGPTHVERLVYFVTDGSTADPLTHDLQRWLEGSRSFRAFVEAHRDKVRKKLRTSTQLDARRDVRAELAVAHALLADRRIDLAYEQAGATVGGPDFTVTFRSHVAFNLEVTRWRGDPTALERQLLAKLRQLPPSVPNALLIATESVADLPDLDRVLGHRGRLPEDRLARQRLSRLGGVYAWSEAGADDPRATLWLHGSARLALPQPAARAVLLALETSPWGESTVRTAPSGS